MKIKNIKKFVRSILIILGIILLANLFISSNSLSHGENAYKTIYVANGDTLWSIAKSEKEINSYYEDREIRDIVNKYKKLYNANTVNYEVELDETVIGGIKVAVGNTIYDSTIDTQLKAIF